MVNLQRKESPAVIEPTGEIKVDHVSTTYGLRALEGEDTEVAATVEGSRNHRLNSASFSLGQLVAGKELDYDKAVDSLLSAALKTGLPEQEVKRTILSGIQAGMKQPRNAATSMFADVKLAESTSALPRQIVDFISFKEMINRKVQTEALIKGLDRRAINSLFGETGLMKTFVAIDAGLCIASGKDWHGHKVNSGPVFYICGEGFAGVSKRLKAWKLKHPDVTDSIPFFTSNNSVDISDPDCVQQVVKIIQAMSDQHGQPALVIIDTLNRNWRRR